MHRFILAQLRAECGCITGELLNYIPLQKSPMFSGESDLNYTVKLVARFYRSFIHYEKWEGK